MKSMTGFARVELADGPNNLEVAVELKSVNSKYKDINIYLDKQYSFVEEELLKLISKRITRARLDAKVDIRDKGTMGLEVNLDLARAYDQALKAIKEDLEINEDIALSDIIRFEDIITYKQEDSSKKLVLDLSCQAVELALENLDNTRSREGDLLRKDIEARLDLLEDELKEIVARSDRLVDEYREKLNKRLDGIMDIDSEYMDKRLAYEIIVYSEKADISEEITRLRSHLDLMRETMYSVESSGKKLDFICQELLREANTIGSKTSDIDIINNVIEIKTIIDQIREQVQNIE